jgi:Tfp pilus assembly pilus retraction ATPase PilT
MNAGPTVKIEDLAAELDIAVSTQHDEEEQVRETDSALVRLVNKIVLDAHEAKASDIHIESYPGRQPVRVRFRQDGNLREYLTLPSTYRAALLSRVKIMANLDISEKRRAQDGKILFQNFGPAKLELRLATIPTTDGMEDAVLRVLPGGGATPMEQLGLRPPLFSALQKVAGRPYGILLVCGPTGSGKTTTLHSVLGYINTPDLKIWTAEDPVEIIQAGLRQVQVHPKIGWTFAAAMRSFLRADPDVIMIGEMRDEETARIAIEASLTGHLVLSTLHTNSAPESVVRLLDMGMQPFNFADSMLGILAQRLVRRLCAKCKVVEPVSKQALSELAVEYCTDTALSPDMIAAEWLQRYSGAPKLGACAGVRALRQERLLGPPGNPRVAHQFGADPAFDPAQRRSRRVARGGHGRGNADVAPGRHREVPRRPDRPARGTGSLRVSAPSGARYFTSNTGIGESWSSLVAIEPSTMLAAALMPRWPINSRSQRAFFAWATMVSAGGPTRTCAL